ncbi:retrovirus-related pol polyprotein from transposon TNT 1-94, partial [Tanacetum coccineum]
IDEGINILKTDRVACHFSGVWWRRMVVAGGHGGGGAMVGEIHKEAQQAAGDPTSLRATNKEGAHPHLSSDQTKSARDGLKTTHTDSSTSKESNANDISKKIKMKDLSDLLKDTRSTFFTPDSPQDEPIIVSDESKEEETEKDEDSHATSHNKKELEQQKATAKAEVASPKAKPSYPDINQLNDLLVTSLNPEFSNLLASHDFASCLPTELKELPSKFTELSGEIKELKKHVKDMEIELPGDLIEIPTKLETFTFTISSLTSQVAEMKNIQWELPAEFQPLPVLVSLVQKRLKTLVSLPSLLNNVTETLNRFATMVEIASRATTKDVPSAGQATASPAEGEKNTTKDAETNLQNELVDLLGIDVVEQYHNKKLLFDNYCVKMMKRRKSSKIINCDVITQKGPISLKVYREDGTIEVIANFKVSDLHLAEWREVVQACPDRKEKGWKTIYGLIKTRMEYLDQTEIELKIDFNKPLKEQDPLNELNELANKKRKRTSDLKDHSRQAANDNFQKDESKQKFRCCVHTTSRSHDRLAGYMACKGVGVVASSHKMIRATNPLQAEHDNIREDLAVQPGRNVVHKSDIPENAQREIGKYHCFMYMENGSLANIIKPKKFGSVPESLIMLRLGSYPKRLKIKFLVAWNYEAKDPRPTTVVKYRMSYTCQQKAEVINRMRSIKVTTEQGRLGLFFIGLLCGLYLPHFHPLDGCTDVYKWLEENIKSVIGINKDDIDEEDDESSTMEPPSRNEAIKAAITLNNFLLSYEKTTPEVLTMLRKIRDEIQGEIDFNKKQKTIESFFKKPS